jgi:ketosteroid isomerase-like protein
MNAITALTLSLCAFLILPTIADEEIDTARIAELDTYWSVVSRAVQEGDFEAYKATCHAEGVLVSGTSSTSYPLTAALARWKKGFDDTKAGNIKASVAFRFDNRIGDKTTAHETGMFHYSTTDADGKTTHAYIHLEAMLVKKADGWKILMEYQKSKGTLEQWKALAGG